MKKCEFFTEEMGFEPMVQKILYADLANQCLQPLSHSSIFFFGNFFAYDKFFEFVTKYFFNFLILANKTKLDSFVE